MNHLLNEEQRNFAMILKFYFIFSFFLPEILHLIIDYFEIKICLHGQISKASFLSTDDLLILLILNTSLNSLTLFENIKNHLKHT